VENFATINRFHNGYLDLLATGGIIKVVFYYLIQLGFLIRIVQWIKINPKLGTTMLALFIGFHLQSIPEAKVLLEGDSMGLISTILILTPLGVEPKTVTTQLRFSSFF
jgi:O-antigen ligase